MLIKVITFPWIVLWLLFSISHVQRSPNNKFPSNVHSKNDLGSTILYTTTGPTCFTDFSIRGSKLIC